MRLPCTPPGLNPGETVLRLRGCYTWELLHERMEDGVAVLENLERVEDLAAFLERSIG